MSFVQVIFGFLVVINAVSFFVMAYDKHKAKNSHGHRRTPEGLILLLGAIFGGLGIYASMFIFHHKTKKWYFKVGIPLLILQNFVLIYFALQLYKN